MAERYGMIEAESRKRNGDKKQNGGIGMGMKRGIGRRIESNKMDKIVTN